MGAKDKKRFEDMAERDKQRYEREMSTYTPPAGQKKGKKKKDPNAPKRSLSAFFFFCQEERASVKAKFPDWGVGDVAKELGKRWELCQNRSKYEQMATKDKARYEKEMGEYRKKQGSPAKKPTAAAKKAAAAAAVVDDDDEEEEEEDEEEDDDDDE